MQNKTTKFLLDLGVPPHMNGFKYARTAILELIQTPNSNHRWCELYEKIAEQHSTTGKRVERSIRHSIEKTQETGAVKYCNIFPNNIISKPPTGQFLATVAEIVKMED